MTKMWLYFCAIIFSGLCLDYVYANSLKDPYICGEPNCRASEKFKYLPSVIYHYDYRVNVNTWFAGSSNNQSTLNIKSTLSVEFITECEGFLKFDYVSLIDQDSNFPQERARNFADSITQHPLRFAFHDGVITEICPSEGEADWVLNFKRGVLSLFQNSMPRFDMDHRGIERDVHGTCDSTYKVEGPENTSLILMKRRDLTQCMDRYKYLSILQTVRYNFQSKYQTWPVLQSESRCRINVDHLVYKSVNCKERHLFEPFSGRQSGAMTTVMQDLSLVREINKTDVQIVDEKSQELDQIKVRADLLHHHTPYTKPENGELKSARDVLKQLCKIDENTDSESYVRPSIDENLDSGSIVGLWGNLVRSCRGLHNHALAQLLARAPSICPRAKKHVLDALPYIASVGSVELIKEMIIKDQTTDETMEEWLMSMAMIPRPKREMIVSMSELLQYNSTYKLIAFTVSSMVHSYCKHSSKSLQECCEEQQNMKIINMLQNNVMQEIGDGGVNLTRTAKEKVKVSIKALGNIGGFTHKFGDQLMEIIENPAMPTSVKLNAIDAFRKTPCIETREYFLHIFREDFVDIEVRLASYLQVMRCPNLVTIRKILHALQHEPVNQAASFVWSHLDNLGKSSIPSRVEIQGLLSGNTIPKPGYSPDIRKFSRNFEQSVFFDQFNAGGNYEANVIFSPESYLPRSLSLNLTVDMFGESINLLEVKARGEGFETYFESIFGPSGTLSKTKLDEKIESLRFKRSVNDADDLRQKIDELGYENEALNHRKPLGDLAIKVFGNEISYWSAEGEGEIGNSIKHLNPLYQINRILSGKEIFYKKASLFLDTTYAVPTGCGLPLTMNLMGTSYVNLRMAGSISGADNFFTTKNLDFVGKIHPSVALNVAATMGVTAGGLSSTGIRLNVRLYTSTAVEATLKLRGARLAHLDLSLPHAKQEIFGAKSELIVLHGDYESQQMGMNANRIQQSTCSWSAVDKAIGIKICAAYQFPNMTNVENAPYFLMSGPAKYMVNLEKVDPSAKIYSFKYNWDQNDTANVIGFSFDTPDSKAKRMFNASIQSLANSGSAKMEFQSAENSLQAHATYKNLLDDKSMEVALEINGQKQFEAVMSLKTQPQKNGYVLIPKLYAIISGERIAELAGTLKLVQKKSVSQCDVLLEFQTKRLASRLTGYVTWNGPTKGANMQLDYKFLNEKKENIKMEALLSNRNVNSRTDLYAELGLQMTAYSSKNFFTDVKLLNTPGHTELNWNLSSSRSLKGENSKLQLIFAWHKKFNGMKVHTQLTLHRPEIAMTLSYEEAGAHYTALALVSYDVESRDVTVSGRLFWPPGTQLYLDAALNVTLPALHPLSVSLLLHEKRSSEYDININCAWFTGLEFAVAALYQDQSTTNVAMMRLKTLVTSKQFKDIVADIRFTQDNIRITFTIQGEYNDESYGTILRYITYTVENFTAYGQVEFKSKIYSVSLIADLSNNTNIVADMHLDQSRDIHVTYQRWLSDSLKRLSASVNWDANRDPTQKLSVDAKLESPDAWDHRGEVTLYYPDRVLRGEFDFAVRDWLCQWMVKLGWSPQDIILWNVKMYSEADKETVYALLSKMDTPFQGWRDSSFNVMWRYHDNLQAVNGSMTWQKDYLSFLLLGDYLLKTNEFFGEFNAVVNSSIPALPRVAAVARHNHVWKKYSDTLLSFQYNNDGVLMVNSSWLLDRGQKENNITGNIALMSPFQGFKKGLLRTKFVFGHRKNVQGVTHLDLDEKVFTITVDGHMRRITNSMLVVNVTSPIPYYSYMEGRFGFIESDRHLVALITTPNATTGIEILIKLQSTQDFHIYAHLALPIEFLKRALVQAKRSQEEVDFRLGWDKMDFGFTGICHYNSLWDFQYLYKVFTPLEGFEENGLVLKNIYANGLDTEFSVRLSKHKLGVALLVRDNGNGLLQLIHDKINKKKGVGIEKDFSTNVFVVLDTLYYTTIQFDAQINKLRGLQEEDIYRVNANLRLPNQSAIILKDVFVIEDMMTMSNDLHLVTPFAVLQELKSFYTIDMIVLERYNITFTAKVRNNQTSWHESLVRFFYEYDTDEDHEYSDYTIKLHAETPLEVLPHLTADLTVHIDDTLRKITGDIAMPSFRIIGEGHIEMDDNFIDSQGSLNLTSPRLESYYIGMTFRKDFSDMENLVSFRLQVEEGSQNNYISSETVWEPNTKNNVKFKISGALHPVLPPSKVSLKFRHEPADMRRLLLAEGKFGSDDFWWMVNAEQKTGYQSIAVKSPFKGYRDVNITTKVQGEDIKGSIVVDDVKYTIDGKITSREPLEITLNINPARGLPHILKLRVMSTRGEHSMSLAVVGTVQFTLNAKLLQTKNYTDVYLKVDSPHKMYSDIFLKSRLDIHANNRGVFALQSTTPFKSLKHLKVDTDMVFGAQNGYVKYQYDSMPDLKGDGDFQWSFIWSDMYIKILGNQYVLGHDRKVDFDLFYGNTTVDRMATTKTGFHMHLNEHWQFGANGSIGILPNQKLEVVLNALLPHPDVDVHTLSAFVDGGTKQDITKSLTVMYVSDRVKTGLRGKLRNPEDGVHANCSLEWRADGKHNVIDNKLDLKFTTEDSMALDYSLVSPLYDDLDTFNIKGSYTKVTDGVIIVEGVSESPGRNRIGDIDLTYGGTNHTVGNFNITTPFKQLHWLKCNLQVSNTEDLSENMIDVFWPNKSASLNTTHHCHRQSGGSSGQTGLISASIPLSTQHFISSQYGYLEGERWSKGNATLVVNKVQYMQGSFKKRSDKSDRNLTLDVTDIEIENTYIPVGVKYLHEFDDSGKLNMKQATIYNLRNVSSFNMTGRVDVESWPTGKNLKVTAIQANRTLSFKNHYEAKERDLFQGSKIKWAPDVWINYDIHITNMSTHDTESQELTMNVNYPLRWFNLVALYNLQDTLLDGSAKLNWNIKDDNKTSELRGRWDNPFTADANIHHIDIALSHPSFSRDVTLKGKYLSDALVMSNMSMVLEYSEYPDEHLLFRSVLQDHSDGPTRDYKFELFGKHPATNLDLEIQSDLNLQHRWYCFNNYYRYQKSLFYQKIKENKGLLDLKRNVFQYERNTESDWYKLNSTWDLTYPEYTSYVYVNRTGGNDTGIIILSMKDKYIMAHFNKTEDVSYHLIGLINDARSAQLNAWRDFDDVKTVDVSSYIRLNHSRLLTSNIFWRPVMFQQIRGQATQVLRDAYEQLNETLTLLKDTPMEIHETMKNVWNEAKPRIREFLDDLNDLHVIKDDIDEFKTFLNSSYYENDFYVKDIVEFGYYVIDQMSIRNHLESLPDIVNEIWVIMGDTSKSIKTSIMWIIETVKSSYGNFMETINRFLAADFMDEVSALLEGGIRKYDVFIKDLHLKFVHYWETTWANAIYKLSMSWKGFLKSMEPTVLKFVHYAETFMYKVSTETFEFFYARKFELDKVPYFNMVSTFTQDVDRFFKDISSNDAITNISKYSKLLYNVVYDKFLVHIPFRKELQDLTTEIWNEFNKMQDSGTVKNIKAMFWEAKQRLQWWYDYFKVGEALNEVGDVLYKKILEISKTALQYEENHREAKTNFIFDPRKGQIVLEQKLPMSWHAFNQTPDFSEIPEYKAVRDVMDNWFFSNRTILSYYYELKPYLDYHNILPPFMGLALMTGHGTLVTLDRRVYTLTSTGTFLLLRDFDLGNFTLLMESNDLGRYNLLLLADKHLIHVDLYREVVSIGESMALSLPAVVDDWILDREVDSLTMQNKRGVNIECNFLFKTCKIYVEGWYYAKLGGLLGTMNNEQYDDLQTTDGHFSNSTADVAASWNVQEDGTKSLVAIENHESRNNTLCEKFFKNKVSPLQACFSLIDSTPFYEECISGVEPCALSSAYLELCSADHIPIHIPEECVQCQSPQGEIIEEGEFYNLPFVPNSTDVVFIVEAQFCNKELRKRKNLDVLLSTLDAKLFESGLTDNRYAVVVFGGKGIYKNARSLYVNNKVFSTAAGVLEHFDNIIFEKEDLQLKKDAIFSDAFGALSYASGLPFRPGASRTFLMLPCTRCDVNHIRLDYSVVHQVLFDSSVTLHIIMSDEFMLTKKRIAKTLYGVDATLAYSIKDTRQLIGDESLRQQVKLPKTKLGFCASLAIETNGTVFTGKKLEGERGVARRLAGVLGARVAATAQPCRARPTKCECQDGRLVCMPCQLRTHLMNDLTNAIWESDEMDDIFDRIQDFGVSAIN